MIPKSRDDSRTTLKLWQYSMVLLLKFVGRQNSICNNQMMGRQHKRLTSLENSIILKPLEYFTVKAWEDSIVILKTWENSIVILKTWADSIAILKSWEDIIVIL